MKIQVTNKHIKNGIPDGFSCPIALALKDQGYTKVDVQGDYAFIDGIMYTIRRGRRFIRNFDAGVKVRPITAEFIQA